MTEEKTESYSVFDINSEHIDPRLPEWLMQHGIKMIVNAGGRCPGVLANIFEELPEYCHPVDKTPKYSEPLKITLLPTQVVPDLRKLVDEYDAAHGKPYRFIREPLGEDYDRGANLGDLVECLQGWLSEMLITLHRIMECDACGGLRLRAAFNYEGIEEIETIKAAIASLQTQYFEAAILYSHETVRANILRYKLKKLQDE